MFDVNDTHIFSGVRHVANTLTSMKKERYMTH
jgi:hypothetical protein